MSSRVNIVCMRIYLYFADDGFLGLCSKTAHPAVISRWVIMVRASTSTAVAPTHCNDRVAGLLHADNIACKRLS